MSDEEWEAIYWECVKDDFKRRIYEECDKESV